MANIITAGNSTNGGTAISTDTSGTLNIVVGSGSGTTAMSIDASGNVAGVLKSGTAKAYNWNGLTTNTSIDFTDIPSTVKRITVIFNEVSTNGSSNIILQVGAGSVTTSGYVSTYFGVSGTTGQTNSSNLGIIVFNGAASYVTSGFIQFVNISGNTWIASGSYKGTTSTANSSAGSIALSGTLDRVRITTVSGTDTFDAGSINILYE